MIPEPDQLISVELPTLTSKLMGGKAAGICSIHAELSKVGDESMVCSLHVVLAAIWHSVTIPPGLSRGVVLSLERERGSTGLQLQRFPN